MSHTQEPSEPRPPTVQKKPVPLLPRNPATQQMIIVGKRRETAEAQLEQRLRGSRTRQA